jgi:hypothetical protein
MENAERQLSSLLQCILETGADMEYEWQLCWAIGLSSAKNYQLWNHRRRCAMHLGAANAQRELEFAAHFLAEDAKNYHIWAHRQVQHSFLLRFLRLLLSLLQHAPISACNWLLSGLHSRSNVCAQLSFASTHALREGMQTAIS